MPQSSTQRNAQKCSINKAFIVSALKTSHDNDAHYAIQVTEDFGLAGRISGGFLNSLAVNAAEQFIATKFSFDLRPHAISSYIQFLRSTQHGMIYFTCHLISLAASHVVLKVELTPGSKPMSLARHSVDHAPSVIAILTFGTKYYNGLSQHVSSPALTNLPNRERDCLEIDVPFMKELPMMKKFRWWAPCHNPPHGDGVWGHHAGGNIRDVFIRAADNSPLSIYEITWIADLGLQPPFLLEDDLVLRWQVSTLSIVIEYKKSIPEGLECVLVRTHSHVVRDGKYDMDCFIIDPLDNGVIALARHVVFATSIKKRGKKAQKQSRL